MRRLIVLMTLGLVAAVTYPAAAQSLDDDLAKIGNRIDDIKSQISGAEQQSTAIAGEILATDALLQGLVADLRRAEEELAAATAAVADATQRLTVLRDDLENRYRALELTRIDLAATREEAKARAVELYMGGGGADPQSILFSAEEMTAVGIGLEYIATVADATERVVKRLESLEIQVQLQTDKIAAEEVELEAELVRLEDNEARLGELADTVAARKADVARELANQQAQLASVESSIDHFENELAALEREQGRIEALIRSQQSTGTAAPSSGGYVRPVAGPITSGFGYRTHPILGTRRLHTGIDLGVGYGTPIAAAAGGRVILASYYGGYGNTVIIDHGGGISTLYAHQSRIGVSNGASVSAGQTIGYVGSTGLSTGPHLHFEVRQNGTPVNPLNYI